MSENKIKYPSLNGLRAISIFIVFLNHIIYQFPLLPDSLRYFPFIFSDGQFGVNVFFVISGFLITSLLQNEEIKTGTISLKNFFIRRTLRIFPAYYFLLLVYFILEYFNYISISSESWLTAITYTKYFNWNDEWYTAHAWSLSVEEHFYLIWPFLFMIGIYVRKASAFLIILMVPLIRIYFHYHPVTWMNDLTIFYRIDAIVIGCICALYQQQILSYLNKHLKFLFYSSIILIILLPFGSSINSRLNLHLDIILISIGGTHGTIANILIAVVMMYSIFNPQGIWFKFLNISWMNYIGTLSYSLYLWQQFFLHETNYWINAWPQNLILTIIAALLSFYLIEKPFFKIKDRFSSQKILNV